MRNEQDNGGGPQQPQPEPDQLRSDFGKAYEFGKSLASCIYKDMEKWDKIDAILTRMSASAIAGEAAAAARLELVTQMHASAIAGEAAAAEALIAAETLRKDIEARIAAREQFAKQLDAEIAKR